jgi:hypothetical protein
VIDERNRKYLREVTSEGIEILDPTGRAHRIDPSKITDLPDASFGLGKSSRIPPSSMTRIVEKIRNQLKVEEDDFGEYQRLTRRSQSAGHGDGDHLPSSGFLQSQLSIASSLDDSSAVYDSTKLNQYQTLANIKNSSMTSSHIPGAEGVTSIINLPDDKEKEQLISMINDKRDDHDHGNGTSSSSTSSSSTSKTKHYPIPQPSPYEEMLFEKVKMKQLKFISQGTQQVAGGKIFHGQAFISSPNEIIFNDFEINFSYKQKFLLTNTSYTFNSFRLLPLADQIIDFFEIIFTKPGRLSAGVSCQLLIHFNPKINQDINSSIEFYSETGPFAIPLKCFIKRCVPEIILPQTKLINFHEVILGQQQKFQIKIKNFGALGTKFMIEPVAAAATAAAVTAGDDEEEDEEENEEGGATGREGKEKKRKSLTTGGEATGAGAGAYVPIDESQMESAKNQLELSSRVQRRITEPIRKRLVETPTPLSIEQTTGYLDGYGETSITVLCAPLSLGNLSQRFQIQFLDVDEKLKSIDSQGKYVTQHNFIDVQCHCEELPIYLPQGDMIDFHCTLFQRIYRKRFEIANRSSNTYIVNIKIPPPFNEFLEVNPTTIYVQGKLSQTVNLKFEPKETILEQLKYYSVRHAGFQQAASFLIPLEIQVPPLPPCPSPPSSLLTPPPLTISRL